MFSAMIDKIRYADFLGAITVKELRQGIRKNSFAVQFCLFQIGLIFYILVIDGNTNTSSNSFLYTIIVSIVILFFANNSNSKEYKPIFHELVTHTKLNSWEFILQKFAALNIQGFLIVISISPFIAYKHYYGQLNLIQFAIDFILAYTCTIFSSPIITMFSATNRSNNPISYFISFGLISAIVPFEITIFKQIVVQDTLSSTILNLIFVIITSALIGFNILSYATSFITSNLENTTVKRKVALFSLTLYFIFGVLFFIAKLPTHLLILHVNFMILSGLFLFTSLVEPLHPYLKKYPSFKTMLKYNGWAGSIFVALAVILLIFIFQKILFATGLSSLNLGGSTSAKDFARLLNPLPYVSTLMFCWAVLSLIYGTEKLSIVRYYVGSIIIFIVLLLTMGIFSVLFGLKKAPTELLMKNGFYTIILIASLVIYIYHLMILFSSKESRN